MDVELVFRLAGAGIIIAVLNQLLTRAGRDDIALLVVITGLVGGLYVVSREISELFEGIKRIFNL